MSALEAQLVCVRLGEHTRLISLIGEIDLWRLPELQEALEDAISARCRKVIVDLKAAEFVDSSVLGALSLAWKRLRVESGELVLVSDDARILRPFVVSGLRNVFRFERSVQEALAPEVGGKAA